MIVRETATSYHCITQHDHAMLSGWMAGAWTDMGVSSIDGLRQSIVLATMLHDIGWISLDSAPAWNSAAGRPFSFLDEPIERKLPAYRAGIDQVVSADAFAGLLCSLHYASFFDEGSIAGLGPAAQTFLDRELERRSALKQQLEEAGHQGMLSYTDFALGLLKLLDNLSLYAVLNEPGASKHEEHSWYRDGIGPTRLRPDAEPVRLRARWTDLQTIALQPFPWPAKLPYALPYRVVTKADIESIGYPAGFQRAPVQIQVLRFTADIGPD